MSNPILTVDLIMSFGPCFVYNRERVEELFAGATELTLSSALVVNIPALDRIWLACHALPIAEVIPIVNGIADRAVRNHCLTCGSCKAEEWAGEWLSGEDRNEAAAWITARAASKAAAWAAEARAASKAAAWAAEARGAALEEELSLQLAAFKDACI